MKISSVFRVPCLIGSICFLFSAQAAHIYFESERYFDQLRAAGLTFEGLRFGQEYFENNFAKLVLDGDPTGIIGGLAWDAEKFIISDGVDCEYWTQGADPGWPSQPYYQGSDATCYSERINHQGNSITVNRYYTRDDDLSPSGYKYFFGADIEFNNQKILYFTNFGRTGGTRNRIQDFIQETRPELQNSILADNYGTSTLLFIGHDGIELPSTNDDVFVGGGNNSVDGGDGLDRIEFPNTFGKYVVNKLNNGAGYQVWDYLGQHAILRNVEIVRFLDGMELDETYQEFWGFNCPSTRNWPLRLGSSTLTDNVCVRRNRNTGTTNNVWRFFNTRDNAFFYTSSREEAFMVWANSLSDNTSTGVPRTSELTTSSWGEQATRYFEENDWPYVIQGTTFAAATYSPWDAVPLWRFYNYQTGHHFFTVSNEEKDFVIAKSESGEWPFNFEGEAFKVYTRNIPFSEVIIDNSRYDRVIPVYRLYSPSLNRHFFSANEVEIRLMKETGKWNDEGIGFWAEEPCLSFPGENNQLPWDGDCGR